MLARTSTGFIDGVPVLDPEQVWWPVGGLGLNIEGRRMLLAGHVSVPGLRSDALSRVTAVDELRRDFLVDLSAMAVKPRGTGADPVLATPDPQHNWSTRLVNDSTVENLAFSFTGYDNNRFATSISTRGLLPDNDWHMRLGVARMPGSPWMSFSGVFGSIDHSVILDTTLGRTWSSGMFLQTGMMQTTTNFRPGLIDRITPLWSGYATTGWQGKNWSLYGGLQPTLFHGSVQMDLPTSVDNRGRVQYTRHDIAVRNDPVMFAGAQYRWRHQTDSVIWAAAVTDTGSYSTQFKYRKEF